MVEVRISESPLVIYLYHVAIATTPTILTPLINRWSQYKQVSLYFDLPIKGKVFTIGRVHGSTTESNAVVLCRELSFYSESLLTKQQLTATLENRIPMEKRNILGSLSIISVWENLAQMT